MPALPKHLRLPCLSRGAWCSGPCVHNSCCSLCLSRCSHAQRTQRKRRGLAPRTEFCQTSATITRSERRLAAPSTPCFTSRHWSPLLAWRRSAADSSRKWHVTVLCTGRASLLREVQRITDYRPDIFKVRDRGTRRSDSPSPCLLSLPRPVRDSTSHTRAASCDACQMLCTPGSICCQVVT